MPFFWRAFFPFVSTQKKIRVTLLEKKGEALREALCTETKKEPKARLLRKSLKEKLYGPKKKRRSHKAKRKRKKEK